jgi:hypothetical protein
MITWQRPLAGSWLERHRLRAVAFPFRQIVGQPDFGESGRNPPPEPRSRDRLFVDRMAQDLPDLLFETVAVATARCFKRCLTSSSRLIRQSLTGSVQIAKAIGTD